ncbi:MAG: type II toxin-antitoxin system RelE/ParE family toxin [Oscillatoria sp. PMC 1076.18]|nr:type II toxin-antitoxin system RelE/ParE family toxin [Oscillatoria sp. PMC 1076.18]
MEAQPREIRRYITSDNKVPFAEWFDSLRDLKVKTKINKRLRKVSQGNLGDSKFIGEGVCELRINFGAGYRIYFGQIETTIILLLCGGDKSTQERDIAKALEYWRDYRRRENAN